MSTNSSYLDDESVPTSSEPVEVVHDNRFGIVPRAVAYATVSVMAKAVYMILAQFGQAFPTHKFIGDRLGVSVSTVQRALRELVTAGLVTVEHRFDANGAQRSSVYHLGAMTYAPPGHGRPTPPVTHDRPPRSPVTDIRKQREGNNGKGPLRRNYQDALDLAKKYEQEEQRELDA